MFKSFSIITNVSKTQKTHDFVFKGTTFSSWMVANREDGLSTTDILSQMFLQIINLFLFLSSPFMAVKYSNVLSNFYEETARVGRKLTSDGLISAECAKVIAEKSLNRFAIKVILITLIISSYILFTYFYLMQLEVSCKLDFGITFHLLWISTLSYYPMVYPLSRASVESAMFFSTEFCKYALKKWRKDFKNEFEQIKSELAAGQENVNPGILWNSKSKIFDYIIVNFVKIYFLFLRSTVLSQVWRGSL